jgi:hypothetical protein
MGKRGLIVVESSVKQSNICNVYVFLQQFFSLLPVLNESSATMASHRPENKMQKTMRTMGELKAIVFPDSVIPP